MFPTTCKENALHICKHAQNTLLHTFSLKLIQSSNVHVWFNQKTCVEVFKSSTDADIRDFFYGHYYL